MVTILEWNTLETKVEGIKKLSEFLDTRSKAFGALMICDLLGVELDEAIDAITDGGDDRGVDAVYIDDRQS